MNNNDDYYNVLGVSKDATVDQIKRAYSQLILAQDKKYKLSNELITKLQGRHLQPFKNIQKAFMMLSNPTEKEKYDQLLQEALNEKVDSSNNFPSKRQIQKEQEYIDIQQQLYENKQELSSIISDLINSNASKLLYQSFINPSQPNQKTNTVIPPELKQPDDITVTVSLSYEDMYNGCTQKPINVGRCLTTIDTATNNESQITNNEVMYIDIKPGIDVGDVIRFSNVGNKSFYIVNSQTITLISDLIVEISENILPTNKFPIDTYSRNGLDFIYNCNLSFVDSICGFQFSCNMLSKDTPYVGKNSSGYVVFSGSETIISKDGGFKKDGEVGKMILRINVLQYDNKLTQEQKDNIRRILEK